MHALLILCNALVYCIPLVATIEKDNLNQTAALLKKGISFKNLAIKGSSF